MMFPQKTLLNIRTLIIWFLAMLPVVVYTIYLSVTDEVAEISELSAGYMWKGQITIPETIPSYTGQLFACGKITSHGRHHLVIFLYDTNEEVIYGQDDSDEPFPSGDFCSEIKLHGSLGPGAYKIVVYDSRQQVAETTFQVK